MGNGDSALESARIHARQAIVVAVITGAVSVVTTLIATGNLFHRPVESAAGSGSRSTAGSVLDAPHVYYKATDFRLNAGECRRRAFEALRDGDFKGADSSGFFQWGYQGGYVGGIWCHTDVGQVIFLAAGRDAATTEATRTLLERNFRNL